MKKLLALVTVLALLACAGASAEQAALDAFRALTEGASEAGEASSADALLDAAMARLSGGTDAGAPGLDDLVAITDRDIAAYASARGLKAGQVRNAWYRALADALAERIAQDPEAGERYENARAILALFLSLEDGEGEADRRQIREQMTPEYGKRIAEQCGLPESFVDFVIMDEHWDDDDWKNDDDWRKLYAWNAAGFDDLTVGSRDGGDSTRIADLQSLLISLGYLKGKADGVFGPRTQAALIEFQLANGLPGTGVYDADSLSRAQSQDAVARWDYGDDFWDSRDFDTTGTANTPNSPDTPEVKEKSSGKDTPDSPDVKEKSSEKDTPDTPEVKQEKSSKKDTPDTPDTPDKKKSDDGKKKSSGSKKKAESKKQDSPDSPDTPD